MRVLGIDTSTEVSSVAVATAEGTLAAESLANARGHLEFLAPAIERVCARAGVPLAAIDGVAVGLGPGLFTGLRVGVATAKAIARFAPAPIVGVPSLDVLAHGVRSSPYLVCACVDAKRDEVFAALYRGGDRVSEIATWTPEALAADLDARGEETLVVGNAARALAGPGRHAGEPDHPRAEHLVAMAIPRFGEATPVERLEPLYVRRSEAEIRWEERGVMIERPFRVKVPKRATG